ncbi:sugar ABC transporter permease [Micromonospora sp. R77]|uniref:carbohydrate ABC transporter permease n=1 Tax=Micromonospora sp. R77 TaxID=2925836 RepID=UPI001F609708|nr:sugar ABC transporter permease [Micromonospora sp. R77]MCI4065913.1 sugar ABC transporter permease [Micromonospora sp. R77]
MTTTVPATGRVGADRRRHGRPGVLWALPAGLFFVLFGLAPIAVVAGLSLTRWNGLGDPAWTGLANWRALLDDADLGHGIGATVLLTVLCWAVQTPLALLLGVWAAAPQRNRAILSAAFFLPLLLSTAAIALAWLSLLDPNFGAAATVGPWLGAPDGNLLGDPDRALYVVAFVIAWQFVPFHTLMYQAAVRQIPASLYEAAAIDGAGRVRQFRAVTLPLLRHTIVASSVLMIVGSLTYFESILLLTGGGPGTATRVLPLHMYIKGFVGFDMGYASTLAVLLVAVGTVLSVLIVRTTGYHRMTSDREGL